jgi:hypothetical protein
MRQALDENEADFFGLARRICDAELLDEKMKLDRDGMRHDFVIVVTPDPAHDPGESPILCSLRREARGLLRATIGGVQYAPMRAELQREPKEGMVWVMLIFGARRMLLEEPVDRSVQDVKPLPRGA